MKNGVPFNRLEKLVGKLRHAAVGVPAVKGLFGPFNRLMAMKPAKVFWDMCSEANEAL